ncbi:MAG: MBL fold metallo-hydrolase [Acidobacteriota bacterium]
MPPARVTFLGTGTSHGVPMIGCRCAVCRSTDSRDQRLRPSIYVAVEGGPALLIDTSTDLRQQALANDLARVDAVLFTHAHADHVMGLDELRRFNALSGQKLRVYADARTGAELTRIFAYAFSPATGPGGGVPDLALIEIDGPFVIDGVAIVPVPILHGRQPILGFRIGNFAYLTDCSEVPQASLGLLEGLEVLVLDALRHRPHPTHFSVAEAVAVATRIGARETFFTHICHDLAHAETCAALPPGMALAYDGQIATIATELPVRPASSAAERA